MEYVDIKQMQDGRWVICNPRTGHIYMVLPATASDDEVLRTAADIEGGWLPRDRGF